MWHKKPTTRSFVGGAIIMDKLIHRLALLRKSVQVLIIPVVSKPMGQFLVGDRMIRVKVHNRLGDLFGSMQARLILAR
ncbi:hypothetical protein BGP_0457 [Beggiatoa sp. PS]|nr:hypothetical protein BGP_0457 [Beggiatoa sp. PS]